MRIPESRTATCILGPTNNLSGGLDAATLPIMQKLIVCGAKAKKSPRAGDTLSMPFALQEFLSRFSFLFFLGDLQLELDTATAYINQTAGCKWFGFALPLEVV